MTLHLPHLGSYSIDGNIVRIWLKCDSEWYYYAALTTDFNCVDGHQLPRMIREGLGAEPSGITATFSINNTFSNLVLKLTVRTIDTNAEHVLIFTKDCESEIRRLKEGLEKIQNRVRELELIELKNAQTESALIQRDIQQQMQSNSNSNSNANSNTFMANTKTIGILNPNVSTSDTKS